MTNREYQRKKQRIEKQNQEILAKRKLKKLKINRFSEVKLPSTSKLIAAYLFIVLNIVLAFSMIAMWTFQDLTYLGVLITDVAAQVLTYFIYTIKAKAENTVGGITYDIAMKNEDCSPCG